MSSKITASPEELMRQASMTAHQYFHAAIKTIDDKFGDGYSKQHPELIGSLVRAAASDFNTATAVQAFQEDIAALIDAVNNLRPFPDDE